MMNEALTRLLHDPARLQALRQTELLDTPADPALDRLTRLAARIVAAPIALVALLDADRQVFSGCVGLPEPWASQRETPLSHSLCQHALLGDAPLTVEDARVHPTFIDHRAIADLGVVAYLGIPLRTAAGYPIGSCCVIDTAPRSWTAREVELLEDVAAVVLAEIEGRQAERARQQAEARFRQLAEHIPEVFWLVDLPEEHLIYVSPAYTTIWGRPIPRLSEERPAVLEAIHPDDRPHVLAAWAHAPACRYAVEYRIVRPGGEIRWIRDRAFPIQDTTGQVVRLAGLAEDVTAQKQLEAHLQQHALYDALTGLPNRALFLDRLGQVLGHVQRRPTYQFAVLFLDLDRFKTINDSLGHLVGDQLLQAVAPRLAAVLRTQDTLARLGGDEFVILLEDLQTMTDATHAAARIQAALSPAFQVGGHEVVTSASIGIALSTSGYAQPMEILRDADTAMYRAKANGRARTVIFERGMHTAAQTRLALERDLRRALMQGELRLHYQPIVSVHTQTITAVEALVRWQHPTRGLLPPADFIPIAEDTDLIAPLGEWVLRTACAQTAAWHAVGLPLRVAVNLSPRQVQHPDVVTLLGTILADTGLPAGFLTVELTESGVMDQLDVASRVLAAVDALGVQVALDDFGTGSSALAYLTRLPVTRVKLNHPFVQEVMTDAPRAALARGILALAQSLNVRVTAEGIETVDQMHFFRAAQADALQGYLVGRPMEAAAVPAYLAQAGTTIAALLRGRAPIVPRNGTAQRASWDIAAPTYVFARSPRRSSCTVMCTLAWPSSVGTVTRSMAVCSPSPATGRRHRITWSTGVTGGMIGLTGRTGDLIVPMQHRRDVANGQCGAV